MYLIHFYKNYTRKWQREFVKWFIKAPRLFLLVTAEMQAMFLWQNNPYSEPSLLLLLVYLHSWSISSSKQNQRKHRSFRKYEKQMKFVHVAVEKKRNMNLWIQVSSQLKKNDFFYLLYHFILPVSPLKHFSQKLLSYITVLAPSSDI